MKKFLVITINCLMIALLIQCRSVKSTTEGKINKEENEGIRTKYEDSTHRQDTLFLHCDNYKGYYDKTKKYLYEEGFLTFCLREKAYLGDSVSIQQIAELIPLMRNPFGVFNKHLRGKILFKAVLERLNNFEFVPAPNGDMNVFTYFGSNSRVMYEMIESIDGMPQYDYLDTHFNDKWTPELNELEIDSREYMQVLSKIYWELYKEAYDKGLIKLKDFGQE